MGLVDTKISNDIGTITLNNPKKLNSLCKDLVDDFCAAFADMKQHDVRVVILRARN